MFTDFANVWTIVGGASELPPGKLRSMTVAGERVVLFRDSAGAPAALIDRCPHRGAALSLGKLSEGIVECPFHGWRFDATGANCFVPWNPDAKRELLGATALPLREQDGLLWLYTGREPREGPSSSLTLSLPGVRTSVQSAEWRCHWTRAMENMLDMPHLPFVHRKTIGRGMDIRAEGRMDLEWVPTETGARVDNRSEGRETAARLDYLFPNAMELTIDPPGRTLRIIAVCLPVGRQSTRMIFVTVRSFARARFFDPLFRFSNRRIASEDKAIVESSQPVEVPPPGEERSVRTDAPTLAFRKLYFERLKGSTA